MVTMIAHQMATIKFEYFFGSNDFFTKTLEQNKQIPAGGVL